MKNIHVLMFSLVSVLPFSAFAQGSVENNQVDEKTFELVGQDEQINLFDQPGIGVLAAWTWGGGTNFSAFVGPVPAGWTAQRLSVGHWRFTAPSGVGANWVYGFATNYYAGNLPDYRYSSIIQSRGPTVIEMYTSSGGSLSDIPFNFTVIGF